MLLTMVLGCTKEQTACIATQIEPLASRSRLLKNLAYTTNAEDRWKEALISLLNVIDGELCAKRNRVIHDGWDITGINAVQLDRRAKIARPQSRQTPTLVTEARSVVDPDYIDSLVTRVSVATVAVIAAHCDLIILQEDGLPQPELTGLEVAVRMVMPRHPLNPQSAR
jgi:hypothetical protein